MNARLSIRETGAACRDIVRAALDGACLRPRFVLGCAGCLTVVLLFAHRYDAAWYHAMGNHHAERLSYVARRISSWGDFLRGPLMLGVGLWLAGFLARRARWQQAALACLLAAVLAGVTANVARAVVGRPRPHIEEGVAMRPLSLENAYHSFPSAHAATVFAVAGGLAVTTPAIGLPALVVAGAIGWSRMYMEDHYLSDVLAGAALGLWLGVALGLGARAARPAVPSLSR